MSVVYNPCIELARRYVEQTDVSLFLTGKAGTGKTTFLHDIAAHCPKRHVMVAPTGVAAVNAGGVTIHSFFQLPFDPYLPDVKELVTEYQMPARHEGFGRNKLNIIRSLELLIIDEVSMVRADLMDAIDMTLRRVRRSGRPFGGVQLLMVGDIHQLPPVVTERERPFMERVYPSPFFFHSKALQRLDYVTLELSTVYRQQDALFVDLLNRVRNNQMDADTLAILNGRVAPPPEDAIILTTHNHQADAINRIHMEQLQGESRRFDALVKGDFPETMYPVERMMELKVGERVMFTKNDSSGGGHRYYNGKIATVTGFLVHDNGVAVEVIDDDGEVIHVNREQWENQKYALDEHTGNINQTVEGTFCQYPLRPAWAVTIHKAQGLTFDRVCVNAADAFAFGQVYVALSRCRSLEGLTLTSPLSASVTFNDVDVQRFCDEQPTFEQALSAVSQAERQYYFRQLSDLFGFESVQVDIDRLVDVYTSLHSIYPRQYNALLALREQVVDLAAVGERFCAQLSRLSDDRHPERIEKGADYYTDRLSSLQHGLDALLDVEVDNRDTSRRLQENGTALRERVGQKLACMKAVQQKGFSVSVIQQAKTEYMLAGMPKGKRVSGRVKRPASSRSDSTDVLNHIMAWRRMQAEQQHIAPFMVLNQKTISAIVDYMPTNMAELLAVPGIGRAKAEKYGTELLNLLDEFRSGATRAE